MSRTIAAVMALLLGLNGLFMLFAPFPWYNAVPGVPATGPFNPHFVRDIGAAYMVVAGGLAWSSWRQVQGWPALAAGAGFLTLHACVHVFDASCSPAPLAKLAQDFVGIYLITAVVVGLALFRKPA